MTHPNRPSLTQYVKLFVTRPRWGIHWVGESLHNRFQGPRHCDRFDEYASNVRTAEEILSSFAPSEHNHARVVLEELMKLQVDPDTPEERAVKSFMPEDVAQLCYGIVRLAKPSVIIETGVQRGNTSFYMLKALQANDNGRLYSVDFPAPGTEKNVGELVPTSLRNRWSLILGIGLDEMRRLRQEISTIDMFLHD